MPDSKITFVQKKPFHESIRQEWELLAPTPATSFGRILIFDEYNGYTIEIFEKNLLTIEDIEAINNLLRREMQ